MSNPNSKHRDLTAAEVKKLKEKKDKLVKEGKIVNKKRNDTNT
jgi:hypothetical protein